MAETTMDVLCIVGAFLILCAYAGIDTYIRIKLQQRKNKRGPHGGR